MLITLRSLAYPYGIAVLSVAIALLLMLALNPLAMMTKTPFLLFFGAVVISAWQGGVRAGLVATGLSALISNYFFLEPLGSFGLQLANLVRMLLFIAECTLISAICGALRQSNQRLDRSLFKLQTGEESLRIANHRITEILESITDGFYALDKQWRFAYINSQAEKILKRSRDELLGQNILELFPKAQGTIFEQSFQRVVAERIPVVFESRGVVNPECWYEVHITPLKDELAVYFHEVTERKQAEKEREQLLAREQVAREEAETANRIKDEFLAVLSHELRSPLNPILGWSKLLQTRKFDEATTNRALATIERNAKLQTELIEDLLDVSRILRGKMVLNVATVDLVSTIEAALETVRLAAESKNIHIETSFDHNVRMISGERVRLQQIVWNLVSNAVKFTPAGGRVEVRLERNDSYAQIIVNDTGKGISPEFLPFVFDYFRQEDGKTTRKFGGLGLGLAIASHLTELHGGTIKVESLGEDKGATFIVQLPLMTAIPKIANGNSESLVNGSDLSQLRILVVDDEADMRDLTQTILEQHGAIVRIAASAASALLTLEQFQPDVLISDIGMPQMDGYILMQQVRARFTEQKEMSSTVSATMPKAIALTAYAGEYDRQLALNAGFQLHLSKPVEPEALVKAVSQLCIAEGRRQEAPG